MAGEQAGDIVSYLTEKPGKVLASGAASSGCLLFIPLSVADESNYVIETYTRRDKHPYQLG